MKLVKCRTRITDRFSLMPYRTRNSLVLIAEGTTQKQQGILNVLAEGALRM